MPSGQYFYTNPQAAAIANNLSKIFFGDPEAKAREAELQGLMLQNQIRQQTVDENNTVNDARGSISRLFTTMDPNHAADVAPQMYAEAARLAGRDGFGANDVNVLMRGAVANMGGNDQSIARAFVGAGSGLGTNEGVSIGDRNELQRRALAPHYYDTDQREAGADRRFKVEVNTPGETVYVPNAPDGPQTYTADPAAVSNAFKVEGAKPHAGKVNELTPAEASKMDDLIGAAAEGMSSLDNDARMKLLARATEVYQSQAQPNAATAVQQAVDELTQSSVKKGWFSDTTTRSMKPDAAAPGVADAFTDTGPSPDVQSPAQTPGKMTVKMAPNNMGASNVDQTNKNVSSASMGSESNPIPFSSVVGGGFSPGLYYDHNGSVAQYMGGDPNAKSSWKKVR